MHLENKYIAVQSLNEKKDYPIATLCEILKLNRSSYYKWLRRDASEQVAKDNELIDCICSIQQDVNGIYGYRRMQMNLKRRFGLHCNKKRVYRVMRSIGMCSVIRRKRPNYKKSTPETTADNILERKFTADNVNEKWLTDVTEFKYGNGGSKLYLSAILDLCDNGIVAYKVGSSNNNPLAFTTFDEAVRAYSDAKPLFHSDRGFQYTSRVFKTKLDAQGMTQSMSRAGRCIDNGPMEGFWGSLKSEMYYLRKFDDAESLKAAIDKYIDFYNHRRYQAKLGDRAPMEFRQALVT